MESQIRLGYPYSWVALLVILLFVHASYDLRATSFTTQTPARKLMSYTPYLFVVEVGICIYLMKRGNWPTAIAGLLIAVLNGLLNVFVAATF